MSGVSVAIQTHPARAELAAALLSCLDGRADVVEDPEPDIAPPSPWRTYRHALLTTPPDATHRLILQDDVLVCDGLLDVLPDIVAAHPDRVICLFVAGHPLSHVRPVLDAQATGKPYATLTNQTWIPVVATMWPVGLIEPMTGWVERQRWPAVFTADDEICGRYLRHIAHPPVATVPSLVEHPDTVESLVRRRVHDGRDPARRACVWIEDVGLCDARDVNWNP